MDGIGHVHKLINAGHREIADADHGTRNRCSFSCGLTAWKLRQSENRTGISLWAKQFERCSLPATLDTNWDASWPTLRRANRTGLNPPTKLRELVNHAGTANRLAREMRQNAVGIFVGILLKKKRVVVGNPYNSTQCNSRQTAETKQS